MMVAALALGALAIEVDDRRYKTVLGWGALLAFCVQIGQWIT